MKTDTDQWKKLEETNVNAHHYKYAILHLVLDKDGKKYTWRKDILFNNPYQENWMSLHR